MCVFNADIVVHAVRLSSDLQRYQLLQFTLFHKHACVHRQKCYLVLTQKVPVLWMSAEISIAHNNPSSLVCLVRRRAYCRWLGGGGRGAGEGEVLLFFANRIWLNLIGRAIKHVSYLIG